MHHRREGTLPRLHTLRIDGYVFFLRWLCSQALRRGVNFVWNGRGLGVIAAGQGSDQCEAVKLPLSPADQNLQLYVVAQT